MELSMEGGRQRMDKIVISFTLKYLTGSSLKLKAMRFKSILMPSNQATLSKQLYPFPAEGPAILHYYESSGKI